MDELKKRSRSYHIQLVKLIGFVADIQNSVNQRNNFGSMLLTSLSFIIAILQLVILYMASVINKIMFLHLMVFLALLSLCFYIKYRKTSKEIEDLKSSLYNLIEEIKDSTKQ